MRTILIVGGGYAGFSTAWKLRKKLRPGEARVIVVDPRPFMTYQPFLPEVTDRPGDWGVRSLTKRGTRAAADARRS